MGFFKSLDNIQPEIENTPIGVNFSTVEYTFDSFLKKIEDGSMSDKKIQSDILYSYGTYLDYDNFKDNKTRTIFQSLWTNVRFLRNFLEVLTKNPNIVESLKTFKLTTINTISYDYYCATSNESKDSEVLSLLLDICRVVDMKFIIPLCTIMDTDSALFITMAKFSSFDQDKCVHRLNEFIIRLGYDFTIKNIIYIYSRFYNEGFATLFNYTMICDDTVQYIDARDKKNYDSISLAIINILNSMTSDEIYKVLKQYGNYIALMNKGTSVRFSLRSLSADYNRVSDVVEKLNSEYMIIP